MRTFSFILLVSYFVILETNGVRIRNPGGGPSSRISIGSLRSRGQQNGLILNGNSRIFGGSRNLERQTGIFKSNGNSGILDGRPRSRMFSRNSRNFDAQSSTRRCKRSTSGCEMPSADFMKHTISSAAKIKNSKLQPYYSQDSLQATSKQKKEKPYLVLNPSDSSNAPISSVAKSKSMKNLLQRFKNDPDELSNDAEFMRKAYSSAKRNHNLKAKTNDQVAQALVYEYTVNSKNNDLIALAHKDMGTKREVKQAIQENTIIQKYLRSGRNQDDEFQRVHRMERTGKNPHILAAIKQGPGASFKLNSLTSTSKRRLELENHVNFPGRDLRDGRWVFEAKSGKHIKDISEYASEDEVLLPMNTKWEVMSIRDDETPRAGKVIRARFRELSGSPVNRRGIPD